MSKITKETLFKQLLTLRIKGLNQLEISDKFKISLSKLNDILSHFGITWDQINEEKEEFIKKNGMKYLSPAERTDRTDRKREEIHNSIDIDESGMPNLRKLLQIAIEQFMLEPSPSMLNAITSVLKQTREWDKELDSFSKIGDGYGYYITLTDEQHDFLESNNLNLQEIMDKTLEKMILLKVKN